MDSIQNTLTIFHIFSLKCFVCVAGSASQLFSSHIVSVTPYTPSSFLVVLHLRKWCKMNERESKLEESKET